MQQPAPPSELDALAPATHRRAPDVAALKAGGVIKQRQQDLYTVRVKAMMGVLSAAQLHAVAAAAERYGSGELHLTVRQTPEILGVPFDLLPALVDSLAADGLAPAVCGPRVRAVAGCSGCLINPLGLVDTRALGRAVDERFFASDCWGKFKMTFSGCSNDCTRAKGADLGFVGMVAIGLERDTCTACGLCIAACRVGALSAADDGTPVRDAARCVGCADCVRSCPSSAMVAVRTGLAVYAGGKHGRAPRTADHVADLLPPEEVEGVVEATLAWYREHGRRGRRLGHVIEELGVERYKEAVIPAEYRVAAGRQRQTGGLVR